MQDTVAIVIPCPLSRTLTCRGTLRGPASLPGIKMRGMAISSSKPMGPAIRAIARPPAGAQTAMSRQIVVPPSLTNRALPPVPFRAGVNTGHCAVAAGPVWLNRSFRGTAGN